MLGLRLVLGAIALMAVLTAGIGGLAVMDSDGRKEALSLELTLGGDGAYWDAVANGAKSAAAQHGLQLSLMEGIEPHGHATLAIVGAGETASCGGEAILSPHMFHVGIANYAAGRICAYYAAKHAAAGSKIVALIDAAPNSASEPRLQGFRDALCYFEGEDESRRQWQVDVIPIAGDAVEQGIDDLAAIAAQHADAALVFDFTGGSAEALLQSFKSGSSRLQPRLVTFDQSEVSLEAIETGDLAAVVTHDPYQCGYQAVDRLVMFHRSDLLARPAAGKGCIQVPAQLVERGTLAEFRSGLKIAAAQLP
jgi:ABC-type sugar transport system substrate-binding protein